MSSSGAYFAALSTRAAPECSYEHNMNLYILLGEHAASLQARLAATGSSSALLRAAEALSRAIEGARQSHQLASADSADINGLCMAADAISLNAGAIARASSAIAATQAAGDR